jgi:hypothetical protein
VRDKALKRPTNLLALLAGSFFLDAQPCFDARKWLVVAAWAKSSAPA